MLLIRPSCVYIYIYISRELKLPRGETCRPCGLGPTNPCRGWMEGTMAAALPSPGWGLSDELPRAGWGLKRLSCSLLRKRIPRPRRGAVLWI